MMIITLLTPIDLDCCSESYRNILTDIPTHHHINPCYQIFTIMKYGVNRVTLVGNVSVTVLYRVNRLKLLMPRTYETMTGTCF